MDGSAPPKGGSFRKRQVLVGCRRSCGERTQDLCSKEGLACRKLPDREEWREWAELQAGLESPGPLIPQKQRSRRQHVQGVTTRLKPP